MALACYAISTTVLALSCFACTTENRLEPSVSLEEFLDAKDCDDLLRAASELRELGNDDVQAIRTILDSWSDPQAVANLLIHPRFIPAHIRVTSLLKGLNDQDAG